MKFLASLFLIALSPFAVIAVPLPGDGGLLVKDLGLYVTPSFPLTVCQSN